MFKPSNPQSIETCPYNPAHRILLYRFGTHIVKCKRDYERQHGEVKMTECIYNSTHKVPQQELKYHLETCSDRFNLDKHVLVSDKVDRNKYPVPQVAVEAEENWDDEDTPSYNPGEYCRNNVILCQKKVESAARRRDFRMEERQRIQRLQEMGPVNTNQVTATRNVNTAPHTDTSRSIEEDDPYTVEKLQQKIQSGALALAQSSSSPDPWGSEKVSSVEQPQQTASKGKNRIGRGRGRNINGSARQ